MMADIQCSTQDGMISDESCVEAFSCRKRCLSSSCTENSMLSSGTRTSFDDSAATTPCFKPQQKRTRCGMEDLSPTCSEMENFDDVALPLGGWFSKCRGCGWMTSYEYEVQSSAVPCCRRCQDTFNHLPCDKKDKMLQGLLYVHVAWSNAGL